MPAGTGTRLGPGSPSAGNQGKVTVRSALSGDSGARNVDHVLNGTLLPEIATGVLARMVTGESIRRIKVGTDKRGEFSVDIV